MFFLFNFVLLLSCLPGIKQICFTWATQINTFIGSFKALNSECPYTSQRWPDISGILAHILIRFSAHHSSKTYPFKLSMTFMFLDSMVHSWWTFFCSPSNTADYSIIYYLLLASRAPLSWVLDFPDGSLCWSHLYTPVPQAPILRPTLTYSFPKWSYLSLRAANSFYMLITCNSFLWTSDLYFLVPSQCLHLGNEQLFQM